MRLATTVLLIFAFSYRCPGEVSVSFLHRSGELVISDELMVGSKIQILVYSDRAVEQWQGSVYIKNEFEGIGVLKARQCNENESDCPGSAFQAAGEGPLVFGSEYEELGAGIELCSGSRPQAGDWFIVDYRAIEAGACTIDYYDYYVGDDGMNVPLWSKTFVHVPSRDFNGDKVVNLADLSRLAAVWMSPSPVGQEHLDIVADGEINCDDLAGFAEYWLTEL